MTEPELIKALMENWRPFGCMHDDPVINKAMQDKANDIGMREFQYLSGSLNKLKWYGLDDPSWENKDFECLKTYRLSPGYEPATEPEKCHVRMIRGDGHISPVSVSSIDAHIMYYANKPYVPLTSLEYAKKSIANAEFWLKKLEVWGNNEVVKKIYKLIHPEWFDKKDEPAPSVVKWPVQLSEDGYLLEYKGGLGTHPLSTAINVTQFIGIELESQLFGRLYKNKTSGTLALIIDADRLDDYEVCDMTKAHALFKKPK